jgi:protein-S-isoprenylcysteine O-methyltransferase Ste14
MTANSAAHILWAIFLASWWLAGWWVAKGTVKAPLTRRLGYFLGFAVGFVLLFSSPWWQGSWRGVRSMAMVPAAWRVVLWHEPPVVGALLLAAEAAAFAFAWWARIHLGRLWSGMLTLREGHRVVDTGPYRLARHPIYTGFIGASWALALIEARPAVLAGAVVLSGVMAVKAREEERFLRRELGAAAYDAYAARTPMLVPGWRW